jgi:hypothetical protein
MSGNYTVKQGDYVSKVARQFGFSDYRTVWDHGQNSELKTKRKNPNVLLPGDQLFIPDRELRQEARPTDQRHKFEVHAKPQLQLRLVLEDQFEKPIADANCVLVLEGETRKVTTDGEGRLEEILPPLVHDALLIIQDPQTAFNGLQIPVKVGDMDPVDEISGQEDRLNNLGYFAGSKGDPDDPRFRSAVEEFQCDFGLHVDGDCGAKTQAKLKQAHGC